MSNNIAVAEKKCKHRCHLQEGYVGLKVIRFGSEMGYKKCTVCQCHFLKVAQIRCGCCNTKLRTKNPRRSVAVKQKALQFYNENIRDYKPAAAVSTEIR